VKQITHLFTHRMSLRIVADNRNTSAGDESSLKYTFMFVPHYQDALNKFERSMRGLITAFSVALSLPVSDGSAASHAPAVQKRQRAIDPAAAPEPGRFRRG
jgi:hypothetical protein